MGLDSDVAKQHCQESHRQDAVRQRPTCAGQHHLTHIHTPATDKSFVCDIAIFVLKKDVKLQLTNYWQIPDSLCIWWSDGTVICHLYAVGQHGTLYEVKWLRFVMSHHNRFTALFPGPPGWAGARRERLDFMVQVKINRGRHTDHAAGRRSIRTNQCPPPPSSPYLFVGRMPFRGCCNEKC